MEKTRQGKERKGCWVESEHGFNTKSGRLACFADRLESSHVRTYEPHVGVNGLEPALPMGPRARPS
jgi:hypothetical protein